MTRIDSAFFDIRALDTLAAKDTPVHRLDPRVKLITTLIFIVFVASFDRYALTGLCGFFLFPVLILSLADLPVGFLLKKLLIVAPFAFFIGIFNPLFDHTPLFSIGSVIITGGWVSFISIMLKFSLTVSAALILVATSGFTALCLALTSLKIPQVFVVQLLFLHRYLSVLIDEAVRMVQARALRTFGKKGMGIKTVINMLGHLLLRTINRANRIHLAMLSRGFNGEINTMQNLHIKFVDLAFLAGWLGVFIILKKYNLARMIGTLISGINL